MILERTAAYVLVIVCVFQMLLPSWIIKPHCWRSIDVQIGRLRMQARNDADSACYDELEAEQEACASATRMPLLHSWQEEPKRLKICITDSDCVTAWLDRSSHAWMISKDESGKSTSGD
jgi:hypothetical protein